MNWGKGIAIFLAAFMIFITTLAVILMRTDSSLVSEDYYQKEVAYQTEITAEQNAIDIGAELKTEITESGLFVKINGIDQITRLSVKLLRSNDTSLDLEKTSNGPSLYFENSLLQPGKYLLTALCSDGQKDYQVKKEIWIP